MSDSELRAGRRIRIFNIMAAVWFSLVVATSLLILVLAVVPKGAAFDFLKIAFLVVGGAMLLLAPALLILVPLHPVTEPRNLPWPFTLVAGLLFAGIFATGPVSQTADRLGTQAAVVRLGTLLGLFVLPFVVLAIIVPLIVGRFSSDYAGRVKPWGYLAAMVIDIFVWQAVSGKSPLFLFTKPGIWAAVAIGLLVLLISRRRRRSVPS